MKIIKQTVKTKLILLSVLPVVLIGVLFLFIGINTMKSVSKKEILSSLNGMCLQLRQDFSSLYPGNYEIIDGEFYSNNQNIKDAEKLLDRYKKNFQAEVTIFFDNKRALTTITDENGKRIINTTQNNKKVLDTVFSGKNYTSGGVMINGEQYYVSYIPLYDNNKISGMIFAGLSNKNFITSIRYFIINFVIISLVCILILSIIVSLMAQKFANILTSIKNYLNLLVEKQNLHIEMDEKVINRKDEFGDLGRYAQEAGIQLNKMISLDSLTQIYNRRAGTQFIDYYFKEASENNTDYSIVMCDIDHFKNINDSYGHKAGDEVLIRIAKILNSSQAIFTIRWGGEEFLLGFNLSKEETANILKTISEQIRNQKYSYNKHEFNVTVTFGVASYDNQIDASTLVVQADKNLYKGKNNGRNTIVL